MSSTRHDTDDDTVDEAQLPYVYVRRLGFGGSGTVEEVRHLVTNKVYSRKTIPITGPSKKRAEIARDYLNEVTIIRGLNDHHMVSVHDTYVTEKDFHT